MPFAATWIDLEIIIVSEVSQTEKDKHRVISLICGIQKNGNKQMRLFTKQTHRYRKQTYIYQRGKVRRDKLGVWD